MWNFDLFFLFKTILMKQISFHYISNELLLDDRLSLYCNIFFIKSKRNKSCIVSFFLSLGRDIDIVLSKKEVRWSFYDSEIQFKMSYRIFYWAWNPNPFFSRWFNTSPDVISTYRQVFEKTNTDNTCGVRQ